MSPRRPRTHDPAGRRADVLAAARRLFAAHGYAQTSIRAIATGRASIKRWSSPTSAARKTSFWRPSVASRSGPARSPKALTAWARAWRTCTWIAGSTCPRTIRGRPWSGPRCRRAQQQPAAERAPSTPGGAVAQSPRHHRRRFGAQRNGPVLARRHDHGALHLRAGARSLHSRDDIRAALAACPPSTRSAATSTPPHRGFLKLIVHHDNNVRTTTN